MSTFAVLLLFIIACAVAPRIMYGLFICGLLTFFVLSVLVAVAT